MAAKPAQFVEPFAGGGIVGLNVAYRQLAGHVTLVEMDENVAAVWQMVLSGQARTLADRIATFDLNRAAVAEVLSQTPHNVEERAFHTILRNRVNRAGILAEGAGMLRSGEGGKGIKSRWYPETLRKRILEIDKIRERITFVKGDGLRVLKQHTESVTEDNAAAIQSPSSTALPTNGTGDSSPDAVAVFFVDPPYTAWGKRAGRRLYRHHELDHEELFRTVSRLRGAFLMTYSSDWGVHELAGQFGLDTEEVPMRSSHHVKMSEVLIGPDLDWLRRLEKNV